MRLLGDGTDRDRLDRNIFVRSPLPVGSTLEEGSIRLMTDGIAQHFRRASFLRQNSQRRYSDWYDVDSTASGKESG